MLCRKCNLKYICKTYDFLINAKHEDINIDSCDIFQNKKESQKNWPENNLQNQKKNAIEEIQEIRNSRKNKIFNQLDSSIDKSDKLKKSKIIKCPTCNATTTEDDIYLCEKCSKRVCSCCSVEHNGTHICDDCWGTKHDTVKREKSVDKLDKNATEIQKKSAELKDSLLIGDESKNPTVKAIVPETDEKEKEDKNDK